MSVFRAPYAAQRLATHFPRCGGNAVWVRKGLWQARQPRPKHRLERPDVGRDFGSQGLKRHWDVVAIQVKGSGRGGTPPMGASLALLMA